MNHINVLQTDDLIILCFMSYIIEFNKDSN